MTAGLTVLAVVFVFVCGANDGGTLLALALQHREVPAYGMLAVLSVALLIGPAVFGLAVARVFTERLTDGEGPSGQVVMLAGVLVATGLVLLLTWYGVPSSMTLAVLGGLSGVTLGLGLTPAWGVLGTVLLVAAAAPVVGGGLGFALGLLARRSPTSRRLPAAVRLGHLAAFTGQALAYAANDGQKIFAVVGVAVAAWQGSARMATPPLPVLAAVAVLFAVGAVASVRRIAGGPTFGLLPPRPWHLVSAEVASSAAVLGSSAVGVPVSMTQSIAAGLVGAGGSQGLRRVRWQFAVPVLTSWFVTLPVSFVAGAVVGGVLR